MCLILLNYVYSYCENMHKIYVMKKASLHRLNFSTFIDLKMRGGYSICSIPIFLRESGKSHAHSVISTPAVNPQNLGNSYRPTNT